MFGQNNKVKSKTNPNSEFKRKYANIPEFREEVMLYNRLKSMRKMKDKLRKTVCFAKAVKIGNSAHVTLPRVWLGKDVIIINRAFFKSFAGSKGFEELEVDKLCK